jgi:hypothetical protein
MVQKNTLEELIQPTMVDNELEAVNQANPFMVKGFDGSEKLAGLLVHTDAIGGLSKKNKKDEDKGSFINAIASANNELFIWGTEELLQANELVLIPTEKNVELLDEYDFLKTFEGKPVLYEVVLINEDGSITRTGSKITLPEVIQAVEESDSVAIQDGNYVETVDENLQTVGATDEDEVVVALGESEDETPMEEPPVEEVVEEEGSEEVPADAEPEVKQEEEPEEETSMTEEDTYDEDSFSEEDVVFSNPEDIEDVVGYHIYGDLGLEVDMNKFKARFGGFTTSALPLLEQRPEKGDKDLDYTIHQINLEITSINEELKNLRASNVARLREYYPKLMTTGLNQIEDLFSYGTTDGQYALALKQLEESKQARLANVESECAKQANEKENEYAKARDAYIESEKIRLAREYDSLHRPALEVEKSSLYDKKRSEIEANAVTERHTLDRKRQSEAQYSARQFELKVESMVSDQMAEFLEQEHEVLRQGEEKIRQFLKENRQFEETRIKALQEELALNNKIEQLTRTHTAEIQRLREDAQARYAGQTQRLMDNELRYQEELKVRDETIVRLNESVDNILAKSKAELEELNERYRKDLAFKTETHEQEVTRLMNQSQMWKDDAERQHTTNKRVIFGIIALAIVACIAVGFIGYLLGMKAQADATVPYNAQAMNQVMDTVATSVKQTFLM